MKKTDLIFTIALVVSFVITAFTNNQVVKNIILLLLSLIIIVLTMIKLKTSKNMKTQEKVIETGVLIVAVGTSIYIIFKMLNL